MQPATVADGDDDALHCTNSSSSSSSPAHALCQAVAVGHGHSLDQLQLCKGLGLLVGHVLVHCQLALQGADLALLGADLLQLSEHILGHAVLHSITCVVRPQAGQACLQQCVKR